MPAKKPHPLAVLVGRRIEALRTDRHWTQQELGARIGVSQKWISDIERAKTTLQLDTLARIAGALETAPQELLAEAGPKGPDAEERRILQAVRRAPPRSRAAIRRVIESLADYKPA